jgi:ADP-ribose pyrophosphatase YjhB (NUDIX family)
MLHMDARDGIELRCSAIVVRQQAILLIHRTYDSVDDWVLPGGTPRPGESTASCTRREVREETGLWVDPARVAFVLEVVGPDSGPRTLDIVFAATETAPNTVPERREPGMEPLFVPIDRINELDLRPPLAGHLRGMLGQGRERYAPYLANLWRPAGRAAGQGGSSGTPDMGERGS